MHISQYLIQHEGTGILIDAGSDHEEEMVEEILTQTEGKGIDALLLTHSILPHIENVPHLQDEWDDLQVISSASLPELVGLDAETKIINRMEQIQGLEFSFIDPLLTDVVASNWIYSHETKTLFTAEGVGHYHSPEACSMTSTDLGGIQLNSVHTFHEDKLPYLNYVDSKKLQAAFEYIFTEFDIECIAPIHGTPVMEDEIDNYLDLITESASAFNQPIV